MVEILKQDQYQPVPVEKQIIIIFAGINGFLDDIPNDKIKLFESQLYKFMDENYLKLVQDIKNKKDLDEKSIEELKRAITHFKNEFQKSY